MYSLIVNHHLLNTNQDDLFSHTINPFKPRLVVNWLAPIAYAILIAEGGKNIYLNTLFIVLCLLLALFGNKYTTAFVFTGTIVYFDYTYIPFDNLMRFTTNSFVYFFCLAAIFKICINEIIKHSSLKTMLMKGIFPLFLSCILSLSRFRVSMLSGIGTFFLLLYVFYFIYEYEKNALFKRCFSYSLFALLCGVVVYNLLYLSSYNVTAGVFVGVRDSNNFAFLANICLVTVLFSFDLNKIYKRISFFVLSVFVIITISFSGIVSFFAIIAIYLLFLKKNPKYIMIMVALAGALVLIVSLREQLMTFVSHNSPFWKMLNRISNIINSYKKGDYNGVTTARYGLWQMYLAEFGKNGLFQKAFGDPMLKENLLNNSWASPHNTYIDILIDNGVVGLAVYFIYLLSSLLCKLKKCDFCSFFITIVFAVNLFFRSFSGFFYLFPIA